jgi:hypothetical protein
MVKQSNKEKLSVTLDLDVFAFVNQKADEDSRSISSMINVLLKGIMEKESK